MKKNKRQESRKGGSLFEIILSPGIWRRITSVSLAVVVFLTTYMMILPALTIDLDTVAEEPGMEIAMADRNFDLPAAENANEVLPGVGESQTGIIDELSDGAEALSVGADISGESEAPSFGTEAAPEHAVAEDGEITEPGISVDDTFPGTFDDSLLPPEEFGEGAAEDFAENQVGFGEGLSEEFAENPEEFGEKLSEGSAENPEMETESLPADEQESIDEPTESADGSFDGDKVPEDETEEAETEENIVAEPASVHVLKAEGADYRVTVSYAEEAEIPDGSELQVTEVLPDGSDYGYYVNEATEALSTEKRIMSVNDARFFDITIINGLETVEPKAPVTVLVELADSFAAEENAAVIHYTEDEVKVLETVDPEEAAATIEEAEAAEANAEAAQAEAEAAQSGIEGEQAVEDAAQTEVENIELEADAGPIEAGGADSDAEAIQLDADDVLSDTDAGRVEAGTDWTGIEEPPVEMLIDSTETAPDEFFSEEFDEEIVEDAIFDVEEAPLVGEELVSEEEDILTEAEPAAEESEDTEESHVFDGLMNPIAFVADSFSVYGFVTATLEKTILASDGHNYKVSVTCGADAEIPENAELQVFEITEESSLFDEYRTNAGKLINRNIPTEAIRIFDISIAAYSSEAEAGSDSSYEKTVIEPKAPVNVTITYADGMPCDNGEEMKVVHFAESGMEVLDNQAEEINGKVESISFETNSFSSFATISDRITEPMAAGCIAYFSFDSDADGFSGAGATAAKNGTTVLRDGQSGKALYLNGDGWLNVTGGSNGHLLTGLDEFTVSYWCSTTAATSDGSHGNWAYFAAPNSGGQVYRNEKYVGVSHTGNTITAERYNNNNARPQANSGTVPMNEWHHVTVVYKNGSTLLYVDGQLADEVTSSVDLSNMLGYNNIFQIGRANWGNGEGYKGYIDEFSVFNYALSEDEVALLHENAYYQEAKKVSVQNLVDNKSYIIYNEVWNRDAGLTGTYEYYAIDGNGNLVKVYNKTDLLHYRSDTSLKWKLIVYKENGQETGYYDFYNEETGKYLAPQAAQILSDEVIGLHLNGRQDEQYDSTIEAWDSGAMSFYGYKYEKEGGQWKLKTASESETALNRDWKFFFAEPNQEKPVTQLETVDTVQNPAGLTIRMFDYPSGEKYDSVHSSASNYQNTIMGGKYWDNHHVTTGLVKDKLVDGYPWSVNGNQSMKGLFSANGNNCKEQTADHLFIKSTYDESGYYEFSSFENYAYLGNNSNFTVYKQLGAPNDWHTSYDATSQYYNLRGNFMPYNVIDPNSSTGLMEHDYQKNTVTEFGDPMSEDDPRYGETIYRCQGNLNYHFGMNITADFLMTNGGDDERGNPITFEFNGDDDMWVFVDGVLLLDMGGEHNAHSGSINFETGKIVVQNKDGQNVTNIKECYRNAHVYPDGTSWPEGDDSLVDKYFKDNTYVDYSAHKLQMYFMERGGGCSNLHVKFNLPIAEPGTLKISKELEDVDPGYVHETYRFLICKQDGTPITSIGGEHDDIIALKKEKTGEDIPVDSQGRFSLKAGETAVATLRNTNLQYLIKEIGVDPDEYDVTINNQAVTINNGEAATPVDTVQNRPSVVVNNKPKHLGALRITKQVEGDTNGSTLPRFEFYVYFENRNGEIVPYSQGAYYVMKGDKYCEYREGNLVELDLPEGQRPTPLRSGQYGTIANIPPEYSIYIPDLMPGTHFLVTERLNTMPEGYSFLSKSVTADTYDAVTTDAKYSGTTPDGKIKVDTTADVIVTNVSQDIEYLKDLEINKIWKGDKPHPNEITFTVQATADTNDHTTEFCSIDELKSNGTDKIFRLNESNSWKTRIEHLPVSTSDGRFITYHVTENPVSGYVGFEKDVTDQINVCNLKVVKLWQEGETRTETVRVKVKNSDGKYYAGTDEDGNAVFNDTGVIYDLKQSEGYEKCFYHMPKDDTYTAVEIVNNVETVTGGLAVYRSTVVAFDIENEPTGEQVDPEASGDNPEIHKRIDALRDKRVNPDSPHTGEDLTDLYRLYLDYKINSIQEPAGVDLLFIIDHSGSMNNNAYQGNRYRARAVQDALNGEDGVIAEFLRMNEKNRWAAVGFKGPSGVYYRTNIYGAWPPRLILDNHNAGFRDSEILSGAGTSFTETNSGVSLPNEGDSMLTNYTAGLWRAEQFLLDLAVKADQKKKVVVFISDGIPTLHIPNLNGSLTSAGNADGSYYYPDSTGGCPAEALKEFGYFVNDMTANGYTFGDNMEFYTIGFGGSMQTAHGSALLQNMLARAYGVSAYSDAPEGHFMTINDIDGSGYYNITAADKLKDDLRIITGLKETFTNIVIEDDLSQYVDLYGLTAEADSAAILRAAGAKVTMTDPDDTSRTITLYENGALTDQNNLSGGQKILKNVLYDKSTKTVKVVFEDDYQALAGITYTLSFDVKTTDAAYDKYVESGYDKIAGGDGNQTEITGDADTDYLGTNPANTTSSGKPGFRSNDSAKASYKHNGTDTHKDYPHPVVQAFSAEIHLLKTDQLDKPLEGAKFKLYKNAYNPADTEEARAANEANLVGSEMTSVLKGTGEDQVAEIAVKDLKPGTYYLVETHAPAGYIMSEPVKIDVIVKTTMNNTVSHDTVEVTASIGGKPIAVDGLQQSEEARLLKIINSAGYELPNTGGPGTNLLYLFGSMLIMIAGAGFGLLNRKKEKNNLSAQ